ncbi:3-dehydroquinate synthase II family protein [Amycolatopsis keratiniphila]|uniref:3-dehydroquinate synthase n=1 Tax=Amycolatopsis keratiniphila subsp. keratiniphila TaxID=227715 RepID=A0A1W2LGD1_9PSEU|nr:3-dehydroquinate synthase II [Amycolatopsis keratiniphila]OLZ51212.1 3-dehydroquinate synthase [Amycolatopsis keratiniphila subsp. nogabecina]ONF61888.1 3-dehydroquinate synthase [Amycolatopsis keratiniphila subsp. keratiniphila]SDU30128.1 3-amino-4-hydroxybenzoic acid synthase [Amycolatopsis keratiniphila]
MKFAWIDLRTVPDAQREAVVDAAVHARVDALVHDDVRLLDTLPATVKRVLVKPDRDSDGEGLVRLRSVGGETELNALKNAWYDEKTDIAALVHVRDDATLKLACESARSLPYTVVEFRDPTKIPLEIVIAAADGSSGQLICQADDLEEAQIIVDVLEKGSEGVLLAPRDANDVFGLMEILRDKTPQLSLTKLTVESIEHCGLGDRVCIDTCTHFDEDEGMLVGSYSQGFILCCSETHPLPYMPTRPFRINAGALHSYVFGQDNRTNYLSELKAGSTVLGVGADGRTRRIVVGRIKLESRPLLSIKAVSEEGVGVNLIVQDDWHVRVLGPGGAVLNVTELTPGTQVLGHLATDQRHVGWPVGEFCLEK